jgi:GDP/UDP-N,N'-diacetylbacillosamine 2-epimerase (hydrolysing)
VIDCDPETDSIIEAIQTMYSSSFQAGLTGVVNPYGVPGASVKVVEILEREPLEGVLIKRFHTLKVS